MHSMPTGTREARQPKKHTIVVLDSNTQKKHKVKVFPWTTAQDLKAIMNERVGIPVSQMRLFSRHLELANKKALDVYLKANSTRPPA